MLLRTHARIVPGAPLGLFGACGDTVTKGHGTPGQEHAGYKPGGGATNVQ